ncbi:MAG: uncharacterized protein KVP18_001389 [Porospora cf. gigantea A]|uniref:uncharacterized protein n=1 Tax=Porospora cf. gigantea A TaxID=2853593 RepID=UPI00355A3477|nr:MAG: hypothetical protein KVP18_001389 [Porospora cf. gigantea A]
MELDGSLKTALKSARKRGDQVEARKIGRLIKKKRSKLLKHQNGALPLVDQSVTARAESEEDDYVLPQNSDILASMQEVAFSALTASNSQETAALEVAALLDGYREVLERFEERFAVDEGDDGDDDATDFKSRLLEHALGSSAQREDALTRKQRKLLNRPTIAQLKGFASRPEVCESWDATSPEPWLLVSLKSLRNSVEVPSHWNSRRRYLSSRRGMEKTLFKLPPHIEATKIGEIRASLLEREKNKTLRQKLRERVRPKKHRMDIDYQTLHDAFFKYAVKPHLTKFGDVYHEGKEMEIKMRRFKPGHLSSKLREALGMHTALAPPQWLFNMQRYGPPRAYPSLRIPGVNCPLPPGAEFGFGVGNWGAPPIDSSGRPLWGDLGPDLRDREQNDQGDWTEYLWGDPEAVESEEEDMEDMAEDNEDDEA